MSDQVMLRGDVFDESEWDADLVYFSPPAERTDILRRGLEVGAKLSVLTFVETFDLALVGALAGKLGGRMKSWPAKSLDGPCFVCAVDFRSFPKDDYPDLTNTETRRTPRVVFNHYRSTKVLDVTSGNGTTMLAAEELGISSVSNDISQECIEESKRRLDQLRSTTIRLATREDATRIYDFWAQIRNPFRCGRGRVTPTWVKLHDWLHGERSVAILEQDGEIVLTEVFDMETGCSHFTYTSLEDFHRVVPLMYRWESALTGIPVWGYTDFVPTVKLYEEVGLIDGPNGLMTWVGP